MDKNTAFRANDDLLPSIDRCHRDAVIGMTAVPTMANASETPILRLFRQHQKTLDVAAVYVCTTTSEDAELDRLFYHRAGRIEAELLALPCTSAADFAAKVIVDTAKGHVFFELETGDLWIEARALTSRM